MASFEQAQSFVKQAEGGYGANPADNGNWTGGKVNSGQLIGTNHGISAPVLSTWLGRTATLDDMKNLSYSTALQIYKKNYWDALKLDLLNNQSTALLIYDGAVNQGVGRMKGFIKDTLNTLNIPVSTTDASVLIPKINQANQQTFYDLFKQKRKSAYNPNSTFYKGWMNRLEKLSFFFDQLNTYVKKNKKPILIIVLAVATITTGLIVYKKQIINKLN